MIDLRGLISYPMQPVFDSKLKAAFDSILNSTITGQQDVSGKKQSIRLLHAFLDASGQKLGLESFNQPRSVERLLREYVGFVYVETGSFELGARLNFVYSMKLIITKICEDFGLLHLKFPTPSKYKISDDILECINEYHDRTMNPERMAYYAGWLATDKSGNLHRFPLAKFYNQYGKDLTNQLWDAIQLQVSKKQVNTAASNRNNLVPLLDTICTLCPSIQAFEHAGNAQNIDAFIIQLFSAQKLEVKICGQDVKSFYKKWNRRVSLIDKLFIASKIWSEPAFELFCPSFKTSSLQANTHHRHDEQGNAFNNKLITHIPLSFSDDEAIHFLFDSIDNDIKHVSDACRQLANQTISNLKKRECLTLQGRVKPVGSYRKSRNSSDWIDMSNPANQCATWEHYHYCKPIVGSYQTFLNTANSSFVDDYALLSGTTLYPFLYLLIEQHPAITDSWLQNFQLYDKNGKLYGFKESGDSWIAVSDKPRKGTKNACQTIILNQTSKELIENIIELTSQARAYMKSQGDDNWRRLLLNSMSGYSKPIRLRVVASCKCQTVRNSMFGRAVSQSTALISVERAKSIANNLNLSRMRASCGVRVYLKTRSVKAMAEALGHDKYNPKLLSHYLPDSILAYFQARWVRIFQNALVFEAMKDSRFLMDAVDFSENELDMFLRNHRLKPLPEHILKGQVDDLTSSNGTNSANLSDAIIPVSAVLLSVMSLLVKLIETAKPSQEFTISASEWYETSKYVLESIRDESISCCSSEVRLALAEAEANPLPDYKLMRAIYVS